MINKAFEKAYGKVIWMFSFFILLLFVWFSLISTSTVSLTEKVFFTDISGIPYLVLFVILLGISLIPPINKLIKAFDKKLNDNRALFGIIYFSMIALLFLMSIIWVLLTDFMSWADSAYVRDAAAGLVSGDYSQYLPGGYMERCDNQIGLALFEAPVIGLFGDNSRFVFQFINALCIPVIVASLSRFTGTKLGRLTVLLLGILCFPLLFSVSHIYGNVPGLMLSLLAYVYLFEFFEKGKLRTGILSAFLIAFACLIKQNYMIFLIAYILICMINAARKKKAFILAVAFAALVISALFSKSALGISEQIIGFKIENSISKWAYIAMGLQEGERAPGWFNDYNHNSYFQAGCDSSIQSEMAKAEIGKSISAFSDHPSYMVVFYIKKLASQWNEPTFETIWYLRGPGKELPAPIDYMVSIYGSYKILPYFKFFEVVIYLSAFLYVCFAKKINDRSLLLLTAFIGGVVFHILWEAKAQYALFYFVLLIPVCVNGIGAFRQYVSGQITGRKLKTENKSVGKLRMDLIVCFVLFFIFIGILYYLNIPNLLREGTVPYYQYIVENSI